MQNKPESAEKIFTQALRIKDLQEVLTTHEDTDDLRSALTLRDANESPQVLDALIAHSPSLKQRITVARSDWSTLPQEVQEWLEKENQMPQEIWGDLGVKSRQEVLRWLATNAFNEFHSISPRSKEDLRRMEDLKKRIWGTLDSNERYRVREKLIKAQTAVHALARAESRLKSEENPQWNSLAHEARHAKNLDRMLSSLGKLFDGMGISDAKLSAARPALAQEKFTSPQKRRLEKRLKKALLKEVRGTLVGDQVAAFYRSHPLQFVIREHKEPFLGDYAFWRDLMRFNSYYMAKFLQANNLTPRQLFSDKNVFHQLVQVLAPTFIHESIHRMQHVWAQKLEIPEDGNQSIEMEAFLWHSLYVLEKMLSDPSFKQILEKNADSDLSSKRYLGDARALLSNAIQFKKRTLAAYLQTSSLESAISSGSEPGWGLGIYDSRRKIASELRWRSFLPNAQRARLEKRLSNDVDLWKEGGIGNAKTRALRQAASRDRDPASYALWRQRLKSTIAQVTRRLTQLSHQPVAVPKP